VPLVPARCLFSRFGCHYTATALSEFIGIALAERVEKSYPTCSRFHPAGAKREDAFSRGAPTARVLHAISLRVSPNLPERRRSDEEGNDSAVSGLRRYPPARRQFGGCLEARTERRGRTGGGEPWRVDRPGGRQGGGQEGAALQALGRKGPGSRAGSHPHLCQSMIARRNGRRAGREKSRPLSFGVVPGRRSKGGRHGLAEVDCPPKTAVALDLSSVFPIFSPNAWGKEKGPAASFAASPFVSRCRRQDLNLHDHYGHQALNLARLPFGCIGATGQSHVNLLIINALWRKRHLLTL
jgi:hypothetical protein